jgi:Na+-transporting methylmalonyl-CoA/oxaloacetate decarboxylase gamma subunit
LKKILVFALLLMLAVSVYAADLNNPADRNNPVGAGTPLPANEKQLCAYLFVIPGCQHCANVEQFLTTFSPNYPDLKAQILNANENKALLYSLYTKYSVPQYVNSSLVWGSVPAMFIGNEYYIGDAPILDNLEKVTKKYAGKGVACPDKLGPIIPDANPDTTDQNNSTPTTGQVPLAGQQPMLLYVVGIIAVIVVLIAVFYVVSAKGSDEKKEEKKQENAEEKKKEETVEEKEPKKKTGKKHKKE